MEANRVRELIKNTAISAFTQAGIQVIGFGSSILIVRLLSIREYAFYTLATAALGAMNVIADSGIGQTTLAHGGKNWTNPTSLGVVISTGLRLRRRFSLLVAVGAAPAIAFLLARQQAAQVQIFAVTISLTVLFFLSTSSTLLEIAPRLNQQLAALQSAQLVAAVLRLVLVTTAVLLFPGAWSALIAAAIAQAWLVRRLGTLTGRIVDWRLPVDLDTQRQMLVALRRLMPGALYYAVSGQISIWLISVLASNEAVAQLGALGRLAAAFNVVTAVFSLIVLPRFARMEPVPAARVVRRFWQSLGGLTVILTGIVIAIAAIPGLAGLLFGRNYASAEGNVGLAAMSGAVAVLVGVIYHMGAARGEVAAPWITIPSSLAAQVLLICVLPVSTVRGVLWLGIITNLILGALYAMNFVGRSSDQSSK
jgi:O-antigen/teichoic acid export membrane protein